MCIKPVNEQLKMELADFLRGWTNELQSSMKLNKVTNDSGGLDHPDLNTGMRFNQRDSSRWT